MLRLGTSKRLTSKALIYFSTQQIQHLVFLCILHKSPSFVWMPFNTEHLSLAILTELTDRSSDPTDRFVQDYEGKWPELKQVQRKRRQFTKCNPVDSLSIPYLTGFSILCQKRPKERHFDKALPIPTEIKTMAAWADWNLKALPKNNWTEVESSDKTKLKEQHIVPPGLAVYFFYALQGATSEV